MSHLRNRFILAEELVKKIFLAVLSGFSSEEEKKARWKESIGQIDPELFSCSDSAEMSW